MTAERRTSITVTDEYGAYTVSVNKSGMAIGDVMDELIVPVLLAAGYSRESIESAFSESEVP